MGPIRLIRPIGSDRPRRRACLEPITERRCPSRRTPLPVGATGTRKTQPRAYHRPQSLLAIGEDLFGEVNGWGGQHGLGAEGGQFVGGEIGAQLANP